MATIDAKGHDPKLVAALASLVKRLEATPEELRGPFLVHGLKPYLPTQSLSTQQPMGEVMPPQGLDRETLGRKVREAWVFWAKDQLDPKPTWLVSYDDLSDADKEADRMIGEAIAKWALLCAKSDGTTRRTMGEPVAWQAKGYDGIWRYIEMPRTARTLGMELRPLYALHPNQESGE